MMRARAGMQAGERYLRNPPDVAKQRNAAVDRRLTVRPGRLRRNRRSHPPCIEYAVKARLLANPLMLKRHIRERACPCRGIHAFSCRRSRCMAIRKVCSPIAIEWCQAGHAARSSPPRCRVHAIIGSATNVVRGTGPRMTLRCRRIMRASRTGSTARGAARH